MSLRKKGAKVAVYLSYSGGSPTLITGKYRQFEVSAKQDLAARPIDCLFLAKLRISATPRGIALMLSNLNPNGTLSGFEGRNKNKMYLGEGEPDPLID